MKKIYILTAVFALLTLSLNAQTRATENVTDHIVASAFTATTSNYSNFSGVTFTSDAVYAGNSALDNGVNIQLRSRNSTSGIVTTTSGGKVKSITITVASGTNTVRVYGKNTAYTSAADLYSSATQGTLLGSTSSTGTITVTGDYEYLGIRSNSGAVYISSIDVVWEREVSGPTIQVSTNSLSMSAAPGSSATETVTVTGRNLTGGINASISGTDASVFGVSPASLGTTGGTLTITYSPTAVGTHTATLTLTEVNRAVADPVTITLNGTSSNDVTVCDGTNTNGYLPIYAYYYDNYQKNQMIYPENLLSGLAGKKITSMTFYANGNFNWSGGEVTARLATTDQTSYSSKVRLQPSDMAIVASGFDVPSSGNTWTITFTTPFEYNSGNLVIDMEETSCTSGYGHYSSSSFAFYGVTRTGGGFYSNADTRLEDFSSVYSGGSVQNFLPKVTFTVEDTQPVHDLGITLSEPTAVLAGENATITATVTNNGNQTESGYTVTFSDGTTTFSTQTGGTLAPGATETFTATYTTSAAGTVTITANVACTDDSDATNDEATTTLTVNAPIHDLGITLSAPAEVVGGNAATVTATVTNNGDYTESSYTVTIYADGTAISTPTAVSLAPGESATFTADYATTNAQVGNTVNFTATVACTGDADATNDNAAASTAVITLPPPEHVVATPDNNTMSATVTWDAPSNLPTETTTVTEYVTEDFEDTSVFPTFTTGGVNANSNTGAFGDWTLYDGNGVNVYGMNDVDFGSEVEQTPYAWMPFDLTATTPVWTVTNISAHSGQQFMNSVSVPSATTNHWLISPELSGNAQTISFYDAEMKTNWGAESYEVLYSTTDNNYSSFISLGTYSADALTWGYETANLPAGAKYFAIRHTTNDGFGLMIDDVRYEVTQTNTVTLAPESYNVYLDGVLVGYVDANDPLTYDFSNLSGGQHTVEISAVYPGNIESAKVPAQFTLTPKTATPTITYVVNGDNVVITATGNGTVNLTTSDGQSASGNGSASITVPRTDATFSVTATATAQESGKLESDPATETITIPFLQTATPVITVSDPDENGNVTVTATGAGTVTLTIDGQTVYGNGTASITLTPGIHSYTVTAEATAKEDGKAVSETATKSVTVNPAGGEWLEMYGTYNNDNDLLSLQSLEIGDDGKQKEIMMVDQFLASTLYNTHSDHYTYSMRETVNNEEKSSNLVNIPVYKTSSTMQGFYTQGQVDTADLKMELKPQVINSKMTYDVNPDHNVLYYSLYRGSSDKNENYPVIDESHRVSQLQKFEEMVGDQVQYYMFENHQTGIVPRYDHVGNEIVERLDTNYVQGQYNSELSYVPVIWTFGLYTAREDGKNNSYGSDIKREKLGKTEIVTIGGSLSGNNNAENTGNGWEGYFYKDGVQYCIYTPIFEIEGTTPEKYVQHDGDTSKYVPYMYRVWCLYDGAIDFDNNSQGILVGGDPIKAPFLLGQELVTDPNVNRVTIGRNWTSGQGRLQNAFAVPRSTAQADVEFAVRFYYKKIVTQKAQAPSGLRGNRDGNDEEEEYYIVEDTGNGQSIPVMINEFLAGKTITSVTYVNAQGMTSDKPFDGLNIIVTRYSDGSTSTTKVMR